jgi:hypothetical protein
MGAGWAESDTGGDDARFGMGQGSMAMWQSFPAPLGKKPGKGRIRDGGSSVSPPRFHDPQGGGALDVRCPSPAELSGRRPVQIVALVPGTQVRRGS